MSQTQNAGHEAGREPGSSGLEERLSRNSLVRSASSRRSSWRQRAAPSVRADQGKPSPAWPEPFRRLLMLAGRDPSSDPREAAMRPLGAEWKRRNEGKKEYVLKSQLCVFRCLSLSYFLGALTAASLFPEQ